MDRLKPTPRTVSDLWTISMEDENADTDDFSETDENAVPNDFSQTDEPDDFSDDSTEDEKDEDAPVGGFVHHSNENGTCQTEV